MEHESLSSARSSRVFYLDCLRLLATFGVIMIHVSAQNWAVVDIRSWDRRIYAVYNIAMSWPVAVFVMLSGALFLDPDRPVDIKKLYSKNIFHLIIAFLFWSFVYSLHEYFQGYNLWYVSDTFMKGHIHLWYIFLAIGYYVVTPIFRQITQSKQVTVYFLILTIICLFFIPSLLSLLSYFQLPLTGLITRMLAYWKNAIPIGFTGIYMIYFVLGFYLHKYELPQWLRRWIPLLAVAGYLSRLLLTDSYVQNTGTDNLPFDFAMMDLPVAVVVFLFGKYTLSRLKLGPVGIKRIRSLAAYTFGIYMSHLLIMYKLEEFGLTTTAFSPILSIPLISLVVMAVSFGVSWVFHQIPILKNHVV